MKLKEILPSVKLLETLLGEKLKASVSFDLSKLAKTLNNDLIIYEEAKNKAIIKYGEEKTREVDGKEEKYHQVKDENAEKFSKEMEELFNVEIKAEVKKLKIEDLDDVKISAADIGKLGWLIEG